MQQNYIYKFLLISSFWWNSSNGQPVYTYLQPGQTYTHSSWPISLDPPIPCPSLFTEYAVFAGGNPSQSPNYNTTSNPGSFKVLYNTPGNYLIYYYMSYYYDPLGKGGCTNYATGGPFSDRNCSCIYGVVVSPEAHPKNAIPPAGSVIYDPNCGKIGDPINTALGSYGYNHSDMTIKGVCGNLEFSRFYNSVHRSNFHGMGNGWCNVFGSYVEFVKGSNSKYRLHYPDGHTSDFYYVPNSKTLTYGWSLPNVHDKLAGSSGFAVNVTTSNRDVYSYNSTGKLSKITDRNGNVTRIVYNGMNMDSIIAPGGRFYCLGYNSSGFINQVSDNIGRSTKYIYDNDSNLVKVIDVDSGVTSFFYDSLHQLISVIRPNGNTLLTNKYLNNQVVSQSDGLNNITELSYNYPQLGATTITNPDNSKIVHYHDSFYRLTKIVNEMGDIKEYQYDNDNNITQFSDENGNITTQTFDLRGNLLSVKNALNNVTSYSYNTFDELITIKNPLNLIKTFQRDGRGNIIKVTHPVGDFITYQVNSLGQIIKYTDANNNSFTYTYSSFGDLVSKVTLNGTYTNTYDNVGRIISSTDPQNYKTTFKYTLGNNIQAIEDAIGQKFSIKYDLNDNIVQTTNKRNIQTAYKYDLNDRLAMTTEANGAIYSKTYNNRGNLDTLKDPNGHIVSFKYDLKGRKVLTTNQMGGVSSFKYDNNGNLLQEVNPDGITTKYTYDAMDREITISNSKGTLTKSYNANGKLIQITNPLSKNKIFGYDANSRIIKVTDENSGIATYDYDGNNNIVKITDPNGHFQIITYNSTNNIVSKKDASSGTETRNYDKNGNLISIVNADGVECISTYDSLNRLTQNEYTTGETYKFKYDGNNNIIEASNPSGIVKLTYNLLDKLSSTTDVFNNIISFEYDSLGNRTKINYPGGKSVKYNFNELNQIKTLTDWNNNIYTYEYSKGGKQMQLIYPNGIRSINSYDDDGSLKEQTTDNRGKGFIIVKRVFDFDASGNRVNENNDGIIPNISIENDVDRDYIYSSDDQLLNDSFNLFWSDKSGSRIIQKNKTDNIVFDYGGNNQLKGIDDGKLKTSFYYGAFGERIQKRIGDNVKRYITDLSGSIALVLMETDSLGKFRAGYIYGNGLLSGTDDTNNQYYYHFDASHNVEALSNTSAVITDLYSYEPFGKILQHIGRSEQPYCFLGEFGVERENDSFYYCRARYYDATNGRFLSKDPYPLSLMNTQSINRYVYGLNNPLSIYDYSGLVGSRDEVFEELRSKEISENSVFFPNKNSINTLELELPNENEIYLGQLDEKLNEETKDNNLLYLLGSSAINMVTTIGNDFIHFPSNVVFIWRHRDLLYKKTKQEATRPAPGPREIYETQGSAGFAGQAMYEWYKGPDFYNWNSGF